MEISRILGLVTTITVMFYSDQVTAQIIGDAMRCVEKLLPCQQYIHSDIPPPPWCCAPMKLVAERDGKCLCIAFNHPDVLRIINLTKENAHNLLSSCGINHNETSCSATDSSSQTSGLSGSITKGSYSASTTAVVVSIFGFISVYVFLGMNFF